MNRGRILLAAQNTLLREGLKHLLSTEMFSIVREESTLKDALAFLRSAAEPVDLIYYDQSKDCGEDIESLTALSNEFPKVAVIVLTASETPRGLQLALSAGARAYLSNSLSPRVLTLVIQLILSGDDAIAIPPIAVGVLSSRHDQPYRDLVAVPRDASERHIPLSPREVAILGFLKEGAPNKLIARKLDVAEATVKVHVKSLLRKISVGNRTQAAVWAIGNLNSSAAELVSTRS